MSIDRALDIALAHPDLPGLEDDAPPILPTVVAMAATHEDDPCPDASTPSATSPSNTS